MTKEEALKKAKENRWFLRDSLEWNNDKEVAVAAVQKNGWNFEYASNKLKNDKDVVLTAIQQSGYVLQYASKELKNDKEVVLTAVKENGGALEYASCELRKDKEVILLATANYSDACIYSLLEGYQTFDEIIDKEGEEFLFSCWNNRIDDTRLQVANHPNFLPTIEQIEIGLKDSNQDVRQVYQLRQDEWSAKIEENKLRNTL